MDIKGLERYISHRYRFERYWAYTVSFASIIAGFVVPYFAYTKNGFPLLAFLAIFLIAIGAFGIVEQSGKYKLRVLTNGYTKEENKERIGKIYTTLTGSSIMDGDSHLNFSYQKNWWGLSYGVHLFAGDRQIAVNVQSIGSGRSGFMDFGASKRLEAAILDMVY